MPAPTVVVVYVDEDGDEFPVRTSKGWGDAPTGAVLLAAKMVAEQAVASGEWRPTGELRYARTEEG